MIKLYQFAPAWDVPNLSPFCVKVETYLRMAGLPYEVVDAIPLQGPKGKLPFIEDDGKRIGDSRFIIEYLKQTYGDGVDGHLTPPERAVSNAMQRLIEDDLYWVFVFARWGKRDENWAENRRAIFGRLPPVVRHLVAALARRHMLKQMRGQGMGRHTAAEIYRLGRQDLDALSDHLGEKPWFMGGRPTTLDASAFGILANILWCPIQSPLEEQLHALPNLTAFCERVRERYYHRPATSEMGRSAQGVTADG
jgi:glutathione S-transferase